MAEIKSECPEAFAYPILAIDEDLSRLANRSQPRAIAAACSRLLPWTSTSA